MTCIAGFLDKKSGTVWIGGDSCGSSYHASQVYETSKVFHCVNYPGVIMGGTGTFRHLDLLKYSSELFSEAEQYKKTDITHEYMVTKFIPNLIRLFQNNVVSQEETDRGASFILGVKNHIYQVQADYSVLEPIDGFCAVGCGDLPAMGSFYTTQDSEDMEAKDRIYLALRAASKSVSGVQAPFCLINTEDTNTLVSEE